MSVLAYTGSGLTHCEWDGTLTMLDTPSTDHRMIRKMGCLASRGMPLPLLWLPNPSPGPYSHDGAVQAGQVTDIWYDAPRDAYAHDDPARAELPAPRLCGTGVAYGALAAALAAGEPVGVGVELGTIEGLDAPVVNMDPAYPVDDATFAALRQEHTDPESGALLPTFDTVPGPDGEPITVLNRWVLLGVTCYGGGRRGAFPDAVITMKAAA